jgi:hypothetical protein
MHSTAFAYAGKCTNEETGEALPRDPQFFLEEDTDSESIQQAAAQHVPDLGTARIAASPYISVESLHATESSAVSI